MEIVDSLEKQNPTHTTPPIKHLNLASQGWLTAGPVGGRSMETTAEGRQRFVENGSGDLNGEERSGNWRLTTLTGLSEKVEGGGRRLNETEIADWMTGVDRVPAVRFTSAVAWLQGRGRVVGHRR
ncbi:transcriptional repressor NrdR [Striga asiatica]|uniref:Transcriptional repressor NrdR n=1 Tax=Striga asiatica TaxID=4170 RepID=A0A5A7PA78_STRAF|nr:transcriptional repressor NrdR [Striga asiatica]